MKEINSKYGFRTTEERSRLMGKIKSVNTKAEVRLRKELWRRGYRYRKNYPGIPGKPDIIFIGKKVAVFVDGEFWHGYNWKEKKKRIKSNREYWIKKIEGNMKRDRKVNKELKEKGWAVIRFWEKEVKSSFEKCLEIITNELK